MSKKYNTKNIILGIGLIVIVITVFYLLIFNKDHLEQSKYRIETDIKWLTMQNDGGSHTNVYYDVDFDNNIIIKTSQSYYANLGGNPEIKTQEIYKKELNFKIKKDLKKVLKKTLTKEDINETNNYHCFVIYDLDNEKTICNEDTIKKIKKVLNSADNL